MSYVAISEKFKSDIRDRLRKMRYKELSTIPELTYKLSSTRTDVTEWAWGKHLHLQAQMPASWCNKISSMNVRYEAGERGQVRINAELTPPLVVPPNGAPSNPMTISALDEEIRPYVEREQQLYDINARWNKVDEQINGFFKKCKSVNEALKLWPQVEMYIPAEYISRVNEKRERNPNEPSAAAEVLKTLDTDHLTTAAVISRMSGQE
jgi:hypothetical protein